MHDVHVGVGRFPVAAKSHMTSKKLHGSQYIRGQIDITDVLQRPSEETDPCRENTSLFFCEF